MSNTVILCKFTYYLKIKLLADYRLNKYYILNIALPVKKFLYIRKGY